MSDFLYDMSPIKKVQTIEYVKYKMDITRLYLGENKADISVMVSNSDESQCKIFYYVIEGVDYLNWSSDSFIREWVKQKIRNEIF